MVDSSKHAIPDLPTRALSDVNLRILNKALQKADQPEDETFLIHQELHQKYWQKGEPFPPGRPVDLGIDSVAYDGRIIIFQEYLCILRVINAQFHAKKRGIINVGSPGIGVYPSLC
jgi:hypothetical protein